MRERIFLALSILFLFISGSIFGYVYFSHSKPLDYAGDTTFTATVQGYTQEEVFPSETNSPELKAYRISSYHGHIALFRVAGNGDTQLIEEFFTPVSTLREDDRQLLVAGIEISTREDAEKILENFIH